MLQIIYQTPQGPVARSFFVIDCHSHLGKDVDGAEMMNPQTPGTGTFDFWTKVESRLLNDWEKSGSSYQLSLPYNNTKVKATVTFEQMPLVRQLYLALSTRNKSGTFAGAAERIQNQRLIDQAVCFPFQDQFRDKQPEALYRASNMNIARQVGKFPASLRMIGYMRCDPQQGQKALDEIDYWARSGVIRGLKLHPRSEGWVDNITSSNAVRVLMKAAEYGFPVIFDTRGKQSILDIGSLIRNTRQALSQQNPALLSQFKVIIAHFAQGNVDDEEVYNTITQPNTWGDLSMLHGQGVGQFFTSFRNYCAQHRIHEQTGRAWSEHLLFATDYPYFGDMHAKELLQAVLSQEFFDSGGTVEDMGNIIGLNQLRLLPEYQIQMQSELATPPISCIIQNTALLPTDFPKKPANPLSVDQLMYQILAGLLDDGKADINKIMFQFAGDWHHYEQEFCLVLSSKVSPDKRIPLIYQKIADSRLGLIGTLPKGSCWKHFGMKWFDRADHGALTQMFGNHYPCAVPEDAIQMISNIL
jgi:predicted TIM-barrel fold metal-dependent hydrolase